MHPDYRAKIRRPIEERQAHIANGLTQKDVDRFHNEGELSGNLARLMFDVGAEVIQIGGQPDGPEPVTVIIDS